MKNKSFPIIFYVAIFFAFLAGGYFGYRYYTNYIDKKDSNTQLEYIQNLQNSGSFDEGNQDYQALESVIGDYKCVDNGDIEDGCDPALIVANGSVIYISGIEGITKEISSNPEGTKFKVYGKIISIDNAENLHYFINSYEKL